MMGAAPLPSAAAPPLFDLSSVGASAEADRFPVTPTPTPTPPTTSTTTTKQRSAVGGENYDAKIGNGQQLALPGLGVEAPLPKPRPPRRLALAMDDATLVDEFYERVRSRFSQRTARQYSWVLRDSLRLASQLSRRSVSCRELFTNTELLGRVLADGRASDESRAISAWLASQRRSVARSFALLMVNELEGLDVSDPAQRVTESLQSVAEPIGSGFRLPVGWPRGRGGPMPTPEEAEAVRRVMAGRSNWIGARNDAFLSVLASRGQRIGALLALDGANLHRLPDGQVRMLLHAKSSREPFELALPADAAISIEAYIEGFNSWARASGSGVRIGFGVSGPFWRGLSGRLWRYTQWSRELAEACTAAGVSRFTAHGYRRAFASHATTVVPRSIAALAGNWTSPRRMDDHYVQPSLTRLRTRLARLSTTSTEQEVEDCPSLALAEAP